MNKPATVDEYIITFSSQAQNQLEQMRAIIKSVAPQAQEVISYGMPAFKLNGMLVWYGAHTNHIGFYPRVSAMIAFESDLKIYKTSKGAIQFPLNEALPAELITKIVAYRIAENATRIKGKRK